MIRSKLIGLLAGLLFLAIAPVFGQDCDLTGYRLFIDPGHGGSDSGAIGPTGYYEKTATLGTGLSLRDWLQYLGATVRMSRTGDATVSLTTRATLANNFGAHRFVSVHYNSFSNPAVDGTETFVVPNATARTRHLGQSLQDELVAYIGAPNRGLKTASFTVLVRTSMPAALTESVFISNPDEEAALRDPAYRDWIAAAQAQGLCDHLAVYPGGFSEDAETEVFIAPFAEIATPAGRRAPIDWARSVSLHTLRVIEEGRFFLDPHVSPDGRFLIFAERGSPGLYLIDTLAAESAPQRIVPDAAPGLRFAWSPDSRSIAYMTRTKQGFVSKRANLFTGETDVVSAALSNPAWPVFSPGGDLWLIDPPTGAVIGENASGRPFSPRVFLHDGQVWAERDGQTVMLTQGDMEYIDAARSPEGAFVLSQASHPQGAFLFSIDTQTGAAHNLSLLGVGKEGRFNLSYEGSWSPDGRRVLVNVIRDDGYTIVGSDLYVTDPTGTHWQRLSGGGAVKLHAVWSTLNQIAFDDGAGHIVLADLQN